MKITVVRTEFLRAFALAAKCISSRDVKPILRNVKVEVEEDRCNLSATDLEMGLRIDVGAVRVEKPGVILLPPMTIAVLRALDDEELTIEADEREILLCGARSEHRFPFEESGAFADVPLWTGEAYHEVDAALFARAVRRTAFNVPGSGKAEDAKLRFGATAGVGFECRPKDLTVIGTDGKSCAVQEVLATVVNEHKAAPISSCSKLAVELAASLKEDGTVQVRFTQNDGMFHVEGATVYCRLIEGRFPDWRKFVPKKDEAFKVKADALLQALRVASITSDNDYRRTFIDFAKGKLTLSSQDTESGSGRAEMASEFAGKPRKMSFAIRNLVAALASLDGEEVSFELNGETSPIRLVKDGYQFIQIPMHEG